MGSAYERLLGALRNHGSDIDDRNSDKVKAQCPAHDDGNPSLSIGTRRDGKGVVLCCHAGCDTREVLQALNLTMADLFDEPKVRRIYDPRRDYRYPGGRVVHRKPGKDFPQSGNKADRSLYGSDTITDTTTTVYVVEGEKDVEAVQAAGGVAVCSAMGAGKAQLADWTSLEGKRVEVIADKDGPGRKHAAEIAKLVRGVAASVRIVESVVGKDFADHLAADKTLDDLVTLSPPDSADGAELLDELLATLTRYVVFPDRDSAVAVALWIAATHAVPAFECAPRLVITSPGKRCGKTRLLDVIGGTCHRPLGSANATVAAVYRSLGGDHPPTLILDEADALFGTKRAAEQNEDLRALLNAGHQRGRPALRCVGPNQIPTEFPTFAMAALAGIGSMPDTITDRAVNITQRRRNKGEKVAQFRARRDGPILQSVRDRLAAWAAEQLESLSKAEPSMPVEDRAADTWEPLVAVADAAGGHWPATARAACRALVDRADDADEEQSLAVKLLADIKIVFDGWHVSFISSGDLVSELRRIEDSPWNDFDINPSKLAYRLKDFGIKPGRNPAGNVRGYSLEALSDVFSRYLRQHPSEASETHVEQPQLSDTQKTSDTLARQTDITRQNESAAKPAFLTPLTPSDDPPSGTTQRHGVKNGFCRGCGTYYSTNGEHRADCTATRNVTPDD